MGTYRQLLDSMSCIGNYFSLGSYRLPLVPGTKGLLWIGLPPEAVAEGNRAES